LPFNQKYLVKNAMSTAAGLIAGHVFSFKGPVSTFVASVMKNGMQLYVVLSEAWDAARANGSTDWGSLFATL